MTEQALAIIPKRELERALAMASYHANTAIAVIVLGAIGLGCAILLPSGVLGTLVGLVSGVAMTAIGCVAYSRAARSKATIKTKLQAQQLPAARLLK